MNRYPYRQYRVIFEGLLMILMASPVIALIFGVAWLGDRLGWWSMF